MNTFFLVVIGVVTFGVFATLPLGPFNHLEIVRKACCKLKWHSWGDWEYLKFDGTFQHARCKWCGYKGKIDSLGNLF